MTVSQPRRRKMQIIGVILLPIGAVLLVIGLMNFNQAVSSIMDFTPSGFGV